MTTSDDRYMSLMARDQYFREVKSLLKLTDAERTQLLQRVVRGNAEREKACPNQWILSLAKHARERLVEAFQPLVIRIARGKMTNFCEGLELMDVIQEGNLGLLDAFDTYTDNDGDFLPFASRVIARSIWRWSGYERRRPVESLQGMLFEDEDEDYRNFVSLYHASEVQETERQTYLADLFKQALDNALSPRQREMVQLRYSFDAESCTASRPPSLVAEMLGISSKAMAAKEKEATQRLHDALHVVDVGSVVSYTLRPEYQGSFYTSKEAARVLGVSIVTMRNHARTGQVPVERREGRKDEWVFPRSVIDALAAKKVASLLVEEVAS